jgi:hypothetical protein
LLKKKPLIIILAVLFLIILFVILNRPKTSSKLSEDKFVEVYVQLSIASEMYDAEPAKLEEERKRIFEKYGVTPEEIDYFVKDYNKNPEKWANIWAKIVRRLEEEKANPP